MVNHGYTMVNHSTCVVELRCNLKTYGWPWSKHGIGSMVMQPCLHGSTVKHFTTVNHGQPWLLNLYLGWHLGRVSWLTIFIIVSVRIQHWAVSILKFGSSIKADHGKLLFQNYLKVYGSHTAVSPQSKLYVLRLRRVYTLTCNMACAHK